MYDNFEISKINRKRVKCNDDSTIKEPISFCNHLHYFEHFSILTINNNDLKATLIGAVLINKDHPPLMKNKQSLPLELFDN